MLSVSEAYSIVMDKVFSSEPTSYPLLDSNPFPLMEPLVADSDLPPYDRVAMDGISINYSGYHEGVRKFTIEGCQGAGTPPMSLENPINCIETMTGSILPENCDTVIPYEWLEINENIASLKSDVTVRKGQNIHYKGSDKKQNQIIISKNVLLNGPVASVAASIGNNLLAGLQVPKISIVSTGNELVDIEEVPKPHQIRRSNVYGILTTLKHHGFSKCQEYHLNDNKKALTIGIKDLLEQSDYLIITGGVSKGKFDFIPEVLESLGVKKHFHQVRQRPGMPLFFGTYQDKKLIFGLPGNPVSSLVSTLRYLVPALKKQVGFNINLLINKYAQLTEDFTFSKKMTYFLPVKLNLGSDAILKATPLKLNGSGDFSGLALSDGFIELPEDQNQFTQGTNYPVFLWRGL